MVNKIITTLELNGYKSYIVGGAVRDMIIGINPKDIDIATNAQPNDIMKLFGDNHKVDLVGATFGVVIVDGIEVSTFRNDIYSNDCVNVKYCDNIEEDLSRRDLTINAMALSSDGLLIDPFGGMRDCRAHIIRFVGNADQRIKEDPNRILRALRFTANGFNILSPITFDAIKRNINKIDIIAPERIRKELLKVMESKTPSIFFNFARITGVLEKIFPDMNKQWEHTGGKFHTETIWDHSMIAGNSVSPKHPLVRFAAFLHDIGKPEAFCINNSENFNNHDKIGYHIIHHDLKRLKFTNTEINTITGLCKVHMRMAIYDSTNMKAYRRTLQIFDELGINWEDFIRLRIADNNGNLAQPNLSLSTIRKMAIPFIKKIESDIPFSTHHLVVSGKDLIKYFSLTPGPIIGKLQKHLLRFVLCEGSNKNNRDDLFKEAKLILSDIIL